MEFVKSDSPEMARYIASANVRAGRHWPALVLGCLPNIIILSIIITLSLVVSVKAATWFGVPVLVAANTYLLWWTRSSRLNWVIAAHAGRLYIRPFLRRGKDQGGKPDVIVLELSEVASISIRTVDVFLYGPKPKLAESLMIELPQAAVESASDYIRSVLGDMMAPDLSLRVYLDNAKRLAIGWNKCHPALRVFIQEVVREYPTVVIAPEESSELELNGIWHGVQEMPNTEQRRLLVQAKRLGFGPDCAELLSRYRRVPLRETGAYLSEIEQDEAGTRAR